MNNLKYQELLERKDIFHTEFVDIFFNLYHNYLIELETISDYSNLSEQILNDEVFKKSLTLMLIPNFRWEKVFTNLRKEVCLNTVAGHRYSDSFLSFIESLAIQCFLTDYVYNIDDEEVESIKILQSTLTTENIKFYIPIISCYVAIGDVIDSLPISVECIAKEFEDKCFFEIQVKEKLEIENLEKTLERVGNISDKTSKLVRNQYTENPYPKWRYSYFTPQEFAMTVKEYVNNILCDSCKNSPLTSIKQPKVLIAGCGTGQQIVGASYHKNVKITAIDLSHKSVAYAKRKVNEYGMSNVDFFVMDLLNIEMLGEKFDIIECGGVLHHMKYPEKGLSTLCRVLSLGGYMKIGLYSKKSRISVSKARDIIKSLQEEHITDKIRHFRQKIFNGEFKDLQDLTMMIDFYGLSTCRDYCFHVCENQFTIPDIIRLLENNDLRFCGFNLPYFIKEEYSSCFPEDNDLTNLNNWNIFENNNPDTFRNMYQFIVQSKKND